MSRAAVGLLLNMSGVGGCGGAVPSMCHTAYILYSGLGFMDFEVFEGFMDFEGF